MKKLNRNVDGDLQKLGRLADRLIAAGFALGVFIIVSLFFYVLFTQVIV